MVNSRGGTYTPSPAQQTIVTGISHSPHGSHHSAFSAGASPSTNSPTGSNSLTKITVAQVYLLLSTIKDDKDRTKWEQQAEQLRKLIDDNGMDVYAKYFTRLVVSNASQIFPGHSRQSGNTGNYPILENEVRSISQHVGQAEKIAYAIETANEDIFRDFDLSTFMDHFKLDALEKTILALAFKTGSRSDLKMKADAILATNYPQFLRAIVSSGPGQDHEDLDNDFLATIVDRFIQGPPPNFNDQAQRDLRTAVLYKYAQLADSTPPTEVLAALYMIHLLGGADNELALHIQRIGTGFTENEESCRNHLRTVGRANLDEHQVSAALLYTAISKIPPYSEKPYSATTLVNSLRLEVPRDFKWADVITLFDQSELRISQDQFLELYKALRQLAGEGVLDIQRLWGGIWQNPETQLSFISAYASLSPEKLDATTIPGLVPAFELDEFEESDPAIQERAAQAVRHPLVSVMALSAMFHVALHTPTASDTVEAKRLFQQVVVPNLDIFLVSAFGVAKPWPELANDTINNLFDRFLYRFDPNYDFVLEGLWRKDKAWVAARLVEAHAKQPMELPTILDHAIRHHWLEELSAVHTGFGLDLVAVAHSRGAFDLQAWFKRVEGRSQEFGQSLLTFLNIKAQHELEYQRQKHLHSVMLPVKTVYTLLELLAKFLPPPPGHPPAHDLIVVQRACITAYPRLINYGNNTEEEENFDDIIDANGEESNALPMEANQMMEQHYKRMYSEEVEVKGVVQDLERYKKSRDAADQDVFACMIHGLFDEYPLYHTYPLEALATTAVLFGGIISHKLISNLPLEIGLGMILEAVRDFPTGQAMYKFGLQALMQLFPRLSDWPPYCRQLIQVPGLQGTEPWRKAEDVLRHLDQQNERTSRQLTNGGSIPNGDINDAAPPPPSFSALYVDPPLHKYDDPDEQTQDPVLFILNNLTDQNLAENMIKLKEHITEQNQQWFAGHLVHERAKMQPNFHKLYLEMIRNFDKKSLWADLLRETYVSAFRCLNSDATMQSPLDRQQLKNIAVWLGFLTLARDKPIKHRNIAFKQLLTEGFETERLLVVIPFVCLVLRQGKDSTLFKTANPWVMDIIRGLMELYLNANLKLNLKFEIEVLCSELAIDHLTIQPSNEIMNRVRPAEESNVGVGPEGLDRFDNMSLADINGGAGGGRFSTQEITNSIPDLGPLLTYPPANDMVNQSRLQEIVRSAITRAVHEIIAPVVERSVTIAAISTAQMIFKDFATEPSEVRLRNAAINMVKKTAGALALVTSKEPLRASMTNYIRSLSGELPQGLPEGTIIMCVNSNLDLACSQVEKKAEERAVPEIEAMIEPEMQARRNHREVVPNEPYVDPNLSRWSWTIPPPYKLEPRVTGLNEQQMVIYNDFAQQPRSAPSLAGAAHVSSSSDATRSMANEILQDQYPAVPVLPTPSEPPTHINNQQQAYAQNSSQASAPMANGRSSALVSDPRLMFERLQKTLMELERVAAEAPQQHFADLPRPHPLLDVIDQLFNLIIRGSQSPEMYDLHIVEQICNMLFGGVEKDLIVECLVQVLYNACRIGARTANRIAMLIAHQSGENLLRISLVTSLIQSKMIEWQRVDAEISKAISQRKDGSLHFLSALLDAALLNDSPFALYADVGRSLELSWQWIEEDPTLEIGQQLKQKLVSSGLPPASSRTGDEQLAARQEQMDYIFEEWIHLCTNANISEKAVVNFISQMYHKQYINNKDDLCLFLRISIDSSVDRYEQSVANGLIPRDAYAATDSLAKLIAMLVKGREQEGEVRADKAAYLKSILSLIVLVLNHHHVLRGEQFNQRVFFRLFATLLCEFNAFPEGLDEQEYQKIILVFARIFLDLRPSYFPGFIFGWFGLVSHRNFLPVILCLPGQQGWGLFADIMETMMFYVGDLLKPLALNEVAREIYRGALKFLVLLQHDFPAFLAANHSKVCSNIPSHCIQLHNLILNANPSPDARLPDPLQEGLKIDRLDEIRISPDNMGDTEGPLRQSGLIEVIDRALEIGPSEDAVAHIALAIQAKKTRVLGVGLVPINADVKLIDSLVVYVGTQSIARSAQKGAPVFDSKSPDVALLTLLVQELDPEPRYFLLSSITDQLRFPSNQTHYFSQAILELFVGDASDPDENDIRQQVTRVLLERMINPWPQPWGLLLTIHELVKNTEKYGFFELPFIKADPPAATRFLELAGRGSGI